MTKKPYVIRGAVLGMGYVWAFLRRTPRPVSDELMKFHRSQQMVKLKTILKSLLKFRRVDKFRVMQN